MADNFCRLCGLGMREEPNAICKSVPHWQAWHEIDLRAAYERGVRESAARLNARAKCEQLKADQRGGERRFYYAEDVLREEVAAVLALLGKEGGGDG